MICMYSHWVEASHVEGPQLQQLLKIPQERIFPAWKVPPEPHSYWGTHFLRQILHQECKISPILQYFLCSNHPQSSGFVKQTNEKVKQLAKLVESFNLPWPKALPLILLNLKPIPFGKYRLSPFKIYQKSCKTRLWYIQTTFIETLWLNFKELILVFPYLRSCFGPICIFLCFWQVSEAKFVCPGRMTCC